MPADDLVINVRQIAGYPNLGVQASDTLLMQRGGLGGPYLSAMAEQVVSTALASNTLPLQVGLALPSDASGANISTFSIASQIGALWYWNGYFSAQTGHGKRLGTGPSAALEVNDPGGWSFYWSPPGSAGDQLQDTWTTPLNVDPTGYLTVGNQMLLARDPAAPLEAATARWVSAMVANTVTSLNGRTGDLTLSVLDVCGAAPLHSPRFTGQPAAPTPSPWSCSDRIATTAFAHGVAALYADKLLKDHPFVFSFNGRSGDIVLTAADVSAALAGGTLTVPTAPNGDNSETIANTFWVNRAIASAADGLFAQFAPINSPAFIGTPTALTQPPGDSTGALATTAFVQAALAASIAGVASFNTRTGHVTLELTDITGAGGAPIASPAFTGSPTSTTPPVADDSSRIATTAWVMNELGGISAGVVSFNGRAGAVTLQQSDITGAGGAILVSPVFSGVPTAPTATSGTSTQQLATTAFVMSAVAASAGVTSFNGRQGAITLTYADVSAAGGVANPSPALTGTPTAPLAAPGTNTSQIATTAFVAAAIAAVTGVTSFNGRQGAVTLTSADVTAASPPYLLLAGGTLTGPLVGQLATFNIPLGSSFTVNSSGNVVPSVLINTPPSNPKWIAGASNGSLRWHMSLGTSTPESGANAGADFTINRYDDNGNFVDVGMAIQRNTGQVSFFPNNVSSLGIVGLGPAGPGVNIELRLMRNNTNPATRWVTGWTGGSQRWHVVLGNSLSESGGNVGSDFTIGRYNDAGAQIDNPISIARSTGVCVFSQPIVNGSDRRGKTDIASIDGALAIVEKLKGVYYRSVNGDRREVGLIAQDVQIALPEVVYERTLGPDEGPTRRIMGGDTSLGISYPNIVAVLIEAVKTLSARVQALEATP